MTIEEYVSEAMPKLGGWCSPEKALEIAAIIKAENIKFGVEIGVFSGRSLFATAVAMKANGIGLIYGIDPWSASASVFGFQDANAEWWGGLDHENIYQECARTLGALKLDHHCQLVRKTSLDALAFFQDSTPLDYLHIDGNHSPPQSCFDVGAYVPLVKRGGVILFDDSDWPETKTAQRLMNQLAIKERSVGACLIYRKT